MLSTEDGHAYPIAMIATARPDPGNELFAESVPHEELRLAGLSSADLAALAAGVLGGRRPGPPGVSERSRRGQSFLRRSARSLPPGSRRARFRPRGLGFASPGDRGGACARRRAGPPGRAPGPPDRRGAICRANLLRCLGREFEVRVLSAMLRGDGRLLSTVEAAERAAIWSALDALRYLFQHALLRDAAYDMQIRSRLATLHTLAASGLHEVYADDLAPHYADLAYHYGHAGDPAGERRYSRLAGEARRLSVCQCGSRAIARRGRWH